MVFDFYAVFKCPFPNCGFIAGPYLQSKGVFNVTDFSSPFTSNPYFSYQDAVITVATVSGSLSYLIMMFRVLLVNYTVLYSLCGNKTFNEIKGIEFLYKGDYRRKLLNPFLNSTTDPTCANSQFLPVTLHAKQFYCFYTIFFVNLFLFAGNITTLFVIVKNEIDENFPKWRAIDYIGLTAQLASQYCAIISCFIFSKVAYAVTSNCDKMLEKYKIIIENRGGVELLRRRLEEEDTEFVYLCNDSMKPYRLWFSVHWFMYGLTAFMSIVYLVDTVIDYKQDFEKNYLIILYVFLFTLEHIVLFIYPCFRAASILEARKTLMHKVSLQHWSSDIKSQFLQFMKEQRCGFVLSLVCIRVEFGFNIAYISIFLGFIGIVIKVFSLT